ncbi:MAG: o-succinylbenzoate synthase [Betaproteobacteria bacterium]|nr:o-succinylbenzoate synthase [Betaproteobacteria bacterium]
MRHEFIPYAIAFRSPVVTAAGAWRVRRGAWLRAGNDAGHVGLGEAAPLEPLDSPEALARAIEEGPFREAAFDLASLDLEGQRIGRPVSFLLSDAPRSRVSVNALLFSTGAEATAAEAARAVGEGYRSVKLKVASATPGEDIARIMAVRERVGAAVAIRIDANGAWDEATALHVLNAVEGCNIEYVEDPVAGDSRPVGRRTNIPVAADVRTLEDGWRVMRERGADVLVLKPMALGGVRATRELACAAIDAGIGVVITSVFDTAVGVAGALHLAASLPGPERAHGLATVGLLEEAPVEGLDPPHAGEIQVPTAPGLGVRLREKGTDPFFDP